MAAMPYAFPRGIRIYYESEGAGESLVLIRGFSRSLRYWKPLRRHLRERHRVIVFDHRGIGRSQPDAGRFEIADLADDLAALMAEIGVPRAHVFGLSMGGMVAQRLALDHPERVDHLILGATWCGSRRGWRPPLGTWLALAFSAVLPPRWGQSVAARRIVSPEFVRAHPEVVEDWYWMMRGEHPSFRTLVGQLRAVLEHETYLELPRISQPTLVITGDADRILPAYNSRLIARRIPGASLEVLPGAGHDFPAELPRDTAARIARFLGSD